ncbi:hypothetical protein JEQ12_016822 [Ovis aries]|uniref:Polycystin-2-like protein 2 n=1 Tax=Ovis aries TaxID=9940 RepID=A0A836D346_SHEEP|nr:hypothetical protein JEQ12_016822 [Ovis aries]
MAEASRWHLGVTFGMVNPHMYYLNKVMSSLFLDTSVAGEERTNFKSIRSITDFWKFMEGPLLDGLYWDSWYNNENLYNLKNSSRIYYENILLGLPRVRQLKVRNGTCKVHAFFRSLMDECYDKYTSKNEDMADFGLKQHTDLYSNMKIYHMLGQLLRNTEKYSDFYFLAYWHIYYNNIIAITIFFAWIKLGFLVFGSQVDDFSTFQNAIFTQFRIVLGDFNFAGIQQANRILGPIYFITFIFFVFFVLLNMFLAIINDTYSEVKADYSIGRGPDFQLGKMIKKSYNNALEKLKLKKPGTDEDKKRTENKDLAEKARREGFDEKEIQSAEQMKKWKERLEKKYYSTEIQDDYQTVTQQEFRE